MCVRHKEAESTKTMLNIYVSFTRTMLSYTLEKLRRVLVFFIEDHYYPKVFTTQGNIGFIRNISIHFATINENMSVDNTWTILS